MASKLFKYSEQCNTNKKILPTNPSTVKSNKKNSEKNKIVESGKIDIFINNYY